MYRNVPLIVVSIILTTISLKSYEIAAKSIQYKNEAYRQARASKKTSNSSVTSYYQHDPYGPNTYAFGFEVNDKRTGNVQFRDEKRYLNGSTTGSYGYVRPDGRVTVTRFLSDKQNGYLSHTQTFETGEEHKWEEYWPTKKPTIILERPEDKLRPPLNVSYDKTQHLNMTEGKLPAHVVKALKGQHGLDVTMKTVDLEDDVLNPAVDAIINGKIKLQQQANIKGKNRTIGFETVHNFIPPEFPIVPFKLPTKEEELEGNNSKSQYDEAKMNNAAKAINADSFTKHSNKDAGTAETVIAKGSVQELNEHDRSNESAQLPKPLTTNETEGTGNQLWYENLIKDTRREFLQNIPNLA